MKVRTFLIKDIETAVIVEVTSRKEILAWMNELLENTEYDWFQSDDAFMILYKDGTEDYISQESYDGHKVKKQNIASIVYSNDCTNMVYGNFEINEYGVVTTAFEETIATENIQEVF